MAQPEKTLDIDPAAAQKAYSAIRPRLLDIKPETLVAINLDVQKAAIAAAAVGRMVKEPKPRARFKRLPAEEFEQAHIDDLETIALAAYHASIELLTASAASSAAKLPLRLVQEASTVKQRMLRLVEYHFGDDPTDGPEIASIKLGTGYADLAADLLRLAKLYRQRHAEVKLDPKLYLATDETSARKYAQEIVHELGDTKNTDEKGWSEMVSRALTLLVEVYGEVSDAGKWLYRHEGAEERFPSIYAAGRPGGGRPRKAREGGASPGGEAGQVSAGKAKATEDSAARAG